MSKYDIVIIEYDNDYFFCVYEKYSEQAVDFFYFKEDAETRKEFLETGGAFSGFTPAFILREVSVTNPNKDINKSFEQLLQ